MHGDHRDFDNLAFRIALDLHHRCEVPEERLGLGGLQAANATGAGITASAATAKAPSKPTRRKVVPFVL